MRASQIARLVDGTLSGEGDPELRAVAPLERAESDQLSFLAAPRYLRYVGAARAGAVLVGRELSESLPAHLPHIVVADVHQALAVVLAELHADPVVSPAIHASAVIAVGSRLGESVTIDAYAVIGREACIGDRVRIGAHCVLGAECELGDDVILYPQVTLYRRSRIGARTIVHSGVRIGVDGFGYAHDQGQHQKVPQVGDCVIGADVEIGANSTIDRGSVGSTVIGAGVKIDNLVHIGHNVQVGEGAIIVAQVGVSGSTRIGRFVRLGGQAGLNGHIEIGDGASIAAQAGVFGDIPAGAVYSGYPARPHKESLRAQAALFRLPKLLRRLQSLERAVLGREPKANA
ncbi:MAG: UDP-3-O-(3-hydroxymyristoyl)glucosamine N-acyltransferase [Longimicrobiales bacterium]